jgi:hypothetical protein
MGNMRKILVVLLVVVAVATLIAWGANYANENGGQQADKDRKEAPKGELVANLPKDAKFFDENAQVVESYERPVGSQKQTLESAGVFKTSKSIEQVYNEYLKYAATNGYNVINKSLDKAGASFYGTKADADLSVLILTGVDGQTEVTVTHLSQNRK